MFCMPDTILLNTAPVLSLKDYGPLVGKVTIKGFILKYSTIVHAVAFV